ncbi:DUF4286 family protein [Nocardioides insulae]|uniref:DUF4286 family protein n=1 Tax=Nocardioides insulae TaxID=394734 RepID=UPI000425AFC5|nr:DUF4286 family protein [Nocardioides insulae]
MAAAETSENHGVLVVFTSPADPSREDEFNAWYTGTHVPEIVEKVDGISGAQRYQLGNGSPEGPRPYLALYTLTEPAEKVQAAFFAALPTFTMSDAIAGDPVLAFYDARD